MSKTVAAPIKTALQADTTQISTCWKITLVSTSPPTVLGFTDHDADIPFNGVTYNASSGYTASAIENTPRLEVGNLDVQGLLDSAYITEEDLFRGAYDGAEFEIFWYLRDEDAAVPLMRGFFGEIKLLDGKFVAELRGLTELLGAYFGEKYSYLCRADFGDARCQADTAPHTMSGSATGGGESYDRFTLGGGGSPEGQYRYGLLTWTSGQNAGLSAGIKSYLTGLVVLAVPMPFPIQAGDGYTMVAGCDKTWQTCSDVYDNLIHFRGEPYVPGVDELMRYAPLDVTLVQAEGEYGQNVPTTPVGGG